MSKSPSKGLSQWLDLCFVCQTELLSSIFPNLAICMQLYRQMRLEFKFLYSFSAKYCENFFLKYYLLELTGNEVTVASSQSSTQFQSPLRHQHCDTTFVDGVWLSFNSASLLQCNIGSKSLTGSYSQLWVVSSC